MQTVFHLQICLGRKSSLSRKHSKTFSPAEFSQTQIINNLEIFKDFFTCRIVLAANDQQHGNIQIISTCRTLLAANHQQPGNSQRHFHRQKYLSLKLSTTWKHSKFFSPAEMSEPQIVFIPKKFKDFFACRILLDADHRQPGNIQRLFRLKICLSRRSSIPRKNSKTFSPADLSQPQLINNMKIIKSFPQAELLAANHQQPGNSQQHFHRQKYLSLKLSTTWRHSKFFSPAEISQPQIIIIPKKFKDFFACKTVLAADHRYPENMQTIFHLQICLGRKSSLS